jgi:hypothetical protein
MLAQGLMTVDKIILYISLAISIASYTFWMPIKENWGVSIFYVGTALSLVGYTFVLFRKFQCLITEIILAATVNNLADELFFEPTRLEVNEYITFLIIVIIILHNGRKRIIRS